MFPFSSSLGLHSQMNGYSLVMPWPGGHLTEGCRPSCENPTGRSCVCDLCYRTVNSSGVTDLMFTMVTALASVETFLDYIAVLFLSKIITMKQIWKRGNIKLLFF